MGSEEKYHLSFTHTHTVGKMELTYQLQTFENVFPAHKLRGRLNILVPFGVPPPHASSYVQLSICC